MKDTTRRAVRKPFPAGFTLVEMLVVMGIIALLIGMIFPAVQAIRGAANNARALQEIKSLVTAITAYRTDHGRFPLQFDAAQDRRFESPQHEWLVSILRADPNYAEIHRWNPRRRVYLEILEQAIVAGRWKDPWGNDYRVAMDFTGDRNIGDAVMNGHGTLTNTQVAAWSFGQDGLSGPNAAHRRDDILSW